MATLSNVLAWRIPLYTRAWQATVHRVAKSQNTTEGKIIIRYWAYLRPVKRQKNLLK